GRPDRRRQPLHALLVLGIRRKNVATTREREHPVSPNLAPDRHPRARTASRKAEHQQQPGTRVIGYNHSICVIAITYALGKNNSCLFRKRDTSVCHPEQREGSAVPLALRHCRSLAARGMTNEVIEAALTAQDLPSSSSAGSSRSLYRCSLPVAVFG